MRPKETRRSIFISQRGGDAQSTLFQRRAGYEFHLQGLFSPQILFLLFCLVTKPSVKPFPSLFGVKVQPTSECAVDEGRKSQGNHGYQTRAAMEETSRQSAEAADDDDSASEVDAAGFLFDFLHQHNMQFCVFLCTNVKYSVF